MEETPKQLAHWPRLRSVLKEGLAAGLHLGGQLSISVGGEPRLDIALGVVEPGEPMTIGHLLPWLSSGKTIAAVAMGQLWETGRLDLEHPVAHYIPEFASRGKGDITIRHLLTHTAGIRMLDDGWPELDWDSIIQRICASGLEPRWQPGRTAGYHRSSSWFLLGELIRRITGSPFDRYVREAIFKPLRMSDSWIGMPTSRYRTYGRSIAPLFSTEDGVARVTAWTEERRITRCSPGAGGIGPARDLRRFYDSLIAGGSLGETRIVEPATVDLFTSRQRVGSFDKTFRRPLDWGLGFALESSRPQIDDHGYSYGSHASTRTYGHGGYRSSVGFADPEHDLTVAVIFNGLPTEEAHRQRMHSTLSAIYSDLGLLRRS